MNRLALLTLAALAWLGAGSTAHADEFDATIELFENAGESGEFFDKSYAYAVFPTVGKGALVVGGAHGVGRVYERGRYVGDITLTQLSVGFQAGGQAYSQMVFMQDLRAFKEFTSGEFGFGAGVSAVAITAGANAMASTTGSSASVSGGKKDAKTAGEFYKGMAVFTIAKGGLMYEASLAGQKFNYKALAAE
ncbi:MAG: YSC84-related protein [Steroidobacteraceae bacterium]